MPIYKNETSNIITEKVEDQNGNMKTFKFNPGEQKTTEYVLLDSNLTEVNPAPYFNPLMKATTVTSTGPGNDQTHSVNRETKLIIIHNSSVDVTAFIRSKSNTPGLPIPVNTMRELSVGCNCDQIIFEFTAAGTITVEERK
jgi:hypothetical protein